MADVVNNFGRNAGKIWTTLNEYGSLSEESLLKKTRLKEHNFYAAVGWLARENKICKKGTKYELGETNLTSKIGEDAGKIWRLLNSQRDVDVSSMARVTEIKIRDAYSALGWLAREDKIESIGGRKTDNELRFGLK